MFERMTFTVESISCITVSNAFSRQELLLMIAHGGRRIVYAWQVERGPIVWLVYDVRWSPGFIALRALLSASSGSLLVAMRRVVDRFRQYVFGPESVQAPPARSVYSDVLPIMHIFLRRPCNTLSNVCADGWYLQLEARQFVDCHHELQQSRCHSSHLECRGRMVARGRPLCLMMKICVVVKVLVAK